MVIEIPFYDNGGNLISDSTGTLAFGIYILQITVADETKTVQIVKYHRDLRTLACKKGTIKQRIVPLSLL